MRNRRSSLPLLLLTALTLATATGAVAATSIGWGNLQWPPTYTAPSCTGPTIYGQVWMQGVTDSPGQGAGITAQLGFGPVGSTPDETWMWLAAAFNVDAGNNDEYMTALTYSLAVGVYDYTYRYMYTGDTDWYVAAERGQATITEDCGPVSDENPTWGTLKAWYRD